MEALRVTLNSAQLTPIIDLPFALRDREVEVIVLPTQIASSTQKQDSEEPSIGNLMGCLKEYANPALRELEEGAWERAACEKYLEKMKNGRS